MRLKRKLLTTSKQPTLFTFTTQVMCLREHSIRLHLRLLDSKMILRRDSLSLDKFKRWFAHFIQTNNGLLIDSEERISGIIWQRPLMLATTTSISRSRFHTNSLESIHHRKRLQRVIKEDNSTSHCWRTASLANNFRSYL
jgi:hypothetical protein